MLRFACPLFAVVNLLAACLGWYAAGEFDMGNAILERIGRPPMGQPFDIRGFAILATFTAGATTLLTAVLPRKGL